MSRARFGIDHPWSGASRATVRDSMKVGHCIPGTRIPIVSDDEFGARPSKDAPLLNLAWHISTEINGYMRKQGFDGQIVDIFSVEEFDRFGQ